MVFILVEGLHLLIIVIGTEKANRWVLEGLDTYVNCVHMGLTRYHLEMSFASSVIKVPNVELCILSTHTASAIDAWF